MKAVKRVGAGCHELGEGGGICLSLSLYPSIYLSIIYLCACTCRKGGGLWVILDKGSVGMLGVCLLKTDSSTAYRDSVALYKMEREALQWWDVAAFTKPICSKQFLDIFSFFLLY